MSILVVCPGCHKRFKVSDKYAGQSGKCPSCKGLIKVPGLDEQVTVHEANYSQGAKDSKGVSILKPIEREETKLSKQSAWIIGGVAVAVLLVTWILGFVFDEPVPEQTVDPDIPAWLQAEQSQSSSGGVPAWLLAIGAIVLAPPLVYAAYQVLRDAEKGSYAGKTLLKRVAICSAVYALLWVGFWYIPPEWRTDMWSWLYMAPPLMFVGSFTALCCFDLEPSSSFFHYCFYLAATILLRVVIGLPAVG